MCVAMSCQTVQENAAVKQHFFYKMNQHALVKKKYHLGVAQLILMSCARQINGTVTSHKPGKREKQR